MIFTLVSYDAETNEILFSQEIEDPMIEREDEIRHRDGFFGEVSAPFIIVLDSIEVERGDDISELLARDISDAFRFREATKVDLLEYRLEELIASLEQKEGTT